jgi:hypothetical protein
VANIEARLKKFLRNAHARVFLIGLGMLPIGWVLFEPLGGRSSQEQYRSNEDLYTLLSLVGVLILAIGLVCILVSIYEWVRAVSGNARALSTPYA